MSKLYDQLKQAARQRGDQPEAGGLLSRALQKERQTRDGPGVAAAPAGEGEKPGPPPAAGVAEKPGPSRVSLRRFPFAAAALAAVIFLAVIGAWRAAPWKPPSKHRIDPTALKLDHHLDAGRVRQTNTD